MGKRIKANVKKLKEALGFGISRDFADDIVGIGKSRYKLFSKSRDMLDSNLEAEDRLVKGEFRETMAMWGLTEETIPHYVRYKTREMWCGIGLAVFSGAANVVQMLYPGGNPLMNMLTGFATLSMMCCGVMLAFASAWRRSVCANRKFVPFLQWIKDFFVKE